ncbi:MAG: iron-containing alcohol dehydrogenase [Planctomycetota bacterium]
MNAFEFWNPVRVVFGVGSIARLRENVPAGPRVLMTYGRGSIKTNGVYAQVKKALAGRDVIEYGGIESNPRYETLMEAVRLARRERAGFLLAVGGGSVVDGTKFIAAAIPFSGDPWDILEKQSPVKEAVAFGCVLTLPATASEMNVFAVISRESTHEKLAFGSPKVFPAFSILDPSVTFTLPDRQIANGVVDAWIHVCEQYLTCLTPSTLQDRQAEAILLTLKEVGPKTLKKPKDLEARSAFMWAATQAHNGHLSAGVVGDWATHLISHEITALYGLDHAQALSAVLPGLWRHQIRRKGPKLAQYAARVFGATGTAAERAKAAIAKTIAFFRSLGMKTRMAEHGIPRSDFGMIADRMASRGRKIGEYGDYKRKDFIEILDACD